ncbi:MAG: T9SS type A sorting domain-containing protein [Bacteroidetes bacterium]|nr:MAG: T9SS type A sorting domain-containing protein [Bacteroidota bacterium]
MIGMKSTVIFTSALLSISSAFGQNQNISGGVVFDGEPYLAVNPNNSQHMVVAWMGYVPFQYAAIKTRVSFNGGQSWSSTATISHEYTAFGTSGADPSLEFDNSGNVFLCYIDFNTGIDSGSVSVRKSTDGGLSWGSPAEVINIYSDPGKYPIDRPWIVIDRSGGVNDGNIYVTTMPPSVFGPIPPPYHPYFIRSTDGGVSFDQWRYMDTTNWLAGSIIPQPTPFSAISSNGTFHCVYPSWVFSQNINPQFIFASSDNAGNSFSYNSMALPFNILFGNSIDTLAKIGLPLLADPADANHLAFFILMVPHGDADVYMWESFDGGATWADSVRINDDPIGNNRMQDLIWADFDTDGDLVVSWRDRRNASDSTYTTSSEIWGAVRHKDSTNFYPNFRISDTIVAYNTVLALSGNDFMCIKLRNDTLNAVWGDTRNGKLNIWFQRMSLSGTLLSIQQLSSEAIPSVEIYPNPFSSQTTIHSGIPIKNATLTVFNSFGQTVKEIKNINGQTVVLSRDNLPNGLYFLRLTQYGKVIAEDKLVITG